MKKNHKRILVTIIIGIVLVASFYIVTDAITKYTGFFVSGTGTIEDDFTLCLREQDITLYINTEDIGTTLQNMQLFDELDNFKIKNCLRDNQECLEKEIYSFPTWIINNKKINRDISFEKLSEYSGCDPVNM